MVLEQRHLLLEHPSQEQVEAVERRPLLLGPVELEAVGLVQTVLQTRCLEHPTLAVVGVGADKRVPLLALVDQALSL